MKYCRAFERLWMPFTAHQDHEDYPPVVIGRGEGIYLYGTDGKRYIDAVGSWWVSSFGHCNPFISAAVKNQIDKLEHVLMAGFISDTTVELTDILSGILPESLSRIFYSDDGSTSVEVALKIALQYNAIRGDDGRRAFVSLGGGYHGDTLGAVSVGAIPAMHGLFHERFKKQYFTDSPYCFRCPVDKECVTCDAECMDSLGMILDRHGKSIAACVFEPMVQGAAGMRIYPKKVLRKIFELCRAHGVITIADEVATGLGRTGEMFACDHVDTVPDIMCLAKGLTGGYLPIAVTAVSERIYDEFRGTSQENKTLNHGHTFTGNPLAASAAVAAMKLLVDNQLPKSAASTIKYFSNKLMALDGHENIAGIRHLGFIGAFELVLDRLTKENFPVDQRVSFKLSQKALNKGLILRPLGDVVYFMPPFNVAVEEIDMIFELTIESIDDTLREVL